MKISALFLLPIASLAFSPVAPNVRRMSAAPSSPIVLHNELDDACAKVTDTAEEYIAKGDDIVVGRAMRLANHVPILVTLKALADKAGMSVSQAGIVAAPASFAGVSGALTVPTWCLNVFAVGALCQLASVVRSTLAAGGDELSQSDITGGAVSNWALARMVGSANPLQDTVLAAILTSYGMRTGASGGDVTIGTAAGQIASAMTTTVAALGVTSALLARIPVLNGISGLGPLAGVATMYALVNRSGNGTTRKAVHGGVCLGMLANAVKGGVSLALDVPNLVANVGLAGLAYVTYQAVDGARTAIMD